MGVMLDFQSSAHYGLSCFIALLPVTVWKWLWVSSSQLWRITTSNKGNDFSICLGEAMAWCKEAMLKACFTRPLNRFCAEVFLSHALGLGTLAKTQEEMGSFPASPAFLPSFLHNTEISKWKTMSCSKRAANSLGRQACVKGRVQFPVFSQCWALFSVGRTSMENISRQTGGCWACWVSVGCRFTHPWVVYISIYCLLCLGALMAQEQLQSPLFCAVCQSVLEIVIQGSPCLYTEISTKWFRKREKPLAAVVV